MRIRFLTFECRCRAERGLVGHPGIDPTNLETQNRKEVVLALRFTTTVDILVARKSYVRS
jgi:hypothetical protein